MTKYVLIGIVVIGVCGIAWWALSPLFTNVEVQDELPTNILPPNPNPTEDEATAEPELESPEDTATFGSEPIELPKAPDERLFPLSGTPGHRATGNVRIVETPEEKIVRFEDYNGTNGPDLRIYLASDLEASEFVDLGPSRANKGNINYSVPLDVNVSDYPYVLTWCRAFGVLFDYAEIH